MLNSQRSPTLLQQQWKSQGSDEEGSGKPVRKILALHGWLDNAATWDGVAPLLIDAVQRGTNIMTIIKIN